ncbi:MAG: sulfolactate dehydrogenase [Betaproteobacteria bacterium]|nr:sulfolactate dehydrogenase [Betaproteobacteria bacterium]
MESRLPVEKLTQLVMGVLTRAGASAAMARATAQSLVAAEMAGLGGHGLSRVQLYAQHVKEGRANGTAEPRIAHDTGAACVIDAQGGLAYLAMELATKEAVRRAREFGVAYCGVMHSHHCGAMDYHLAPLAAAGLIGIGFTNSPAAINAWGGKRPLFGTNPVAAVFPRKNATPLTIDLSLTEVARGKLMVAAKEGKPIPEGWAFDADGKPTTDAKAALTGSMAAIGGVKGVLLALMVELLCCALTGAQFGFENDSFFEPGRPASIGHALLAIDASALAGCDAYEERIETLLAAMLEDDGVRLPGDRRHKLIAEARAAGIAVADTMLEQLRALAA